MTIPPNMPELLKSIIEWAVELLQADAGDIYLWDQEIEALRPSITHGFAEPHTGITIKPGEGLSGRVFQSGELIIVDNYHTWEGRSAAFSSLPPFSTMLGVPMRWQERTIGVLSVVADARRHTFDENDVRLTTLFANLAAVAIENAQLYEELQDRSERLKYTLEQEVAQRTTELAQRAVQLETSAQVSREITSILDIDKLLARVVELIRDAFGYYHVNIFLVDKETDRLILRASSGAVSPRLQHLEIGSESFNGEAVQANKALLVNDVAQDPRCLTDEQLPDTQSELVVPLRVGDQVLGTLDVHSAEVNAFTPEDALVVQSLGDQIAVAIENARLYDRSRELAVLEERHRLARELHDSVTQSLFSLDLHARAIATYLKRDPRQAEAQIQQLRQITHDTLQEMRSLIFDLRPASLEEIELVPALRQQIERLHRPDGPELVLQATGERRLPVEVERDLFRIAQEALSNAVKHAGAQRVVVALTIESEQVTLCVTDDGRGFDPASLPASRRAFGLIGMRERAELLNGGFEILSQPGAGTQVKVYVPA
jgi:signal transduction histidine kinase